MKFDSFYETRDKFHFIHNQVFSPLSDWADEFLKKDLDHYLDSCTYVDRLSPPAVSVDASMSINRECFLVSSQGEHVIFFDVGFLALAQTISRIKRFVIAVAEDVEASKREEMLSELSLCAKAMGIALAVEAAYVQGDYEIAMMYLLAIDHGPSISPKWSRVFNAGPMDEGDVEIRAWISRHVMLHEFHHLMFEHSSVAREKFAKFAADGVRRGVESITMRASAYKRSLRGEVKIYKRKGARIKMRKKIKEVIRSDLQYLSDIQSDPEGVVEIACDIQTINDHFSYLREQYPIQRWGGDVLVHLLARPFLTQYILYCGCHIKHSAAAAAANFMTIAESSDARSELLERSLPLGLSRQAARPRMLFDIVETNVIFFQNEFGLPSQLVEYVMALCIRDKYILDEVVADALVAQASFVSGAREIGKSGALGDFKESTPETLKELIQLQLSPFAVPLQMQRQW